MVFKPALAFVALTLALFSGTSPANAVTGRLGGYTAGHVRRLSAQMHGASGHRHSTISSSHSHHHHVLRALSHLGHTFGRNRIAHAGGRTVAVEHDSKNFLWQAPMPFDKVSDELQQNAYDEFWSGRAGKFSPTLLTQAGVFAYDPLHGGIYHRRESVKYIILHSTETGRPADAQRVIASWNNRGLRHPGAQYVVDRDGQIYNTVDPGYASVHVDTHRTIAGINNDDSIGIEIVHTGEQVYTDSQINAVACLVNYLQVRYGIANERVLTHHFVQPSDRRDPVDFDWPKFAYDRSLLGGTQTAFAHHLSGEAMNESVKEPEDDNLPAESGAAVPKDTKASLRSDSASDLSNDNSD